MSTQKGAGPARNRPGTDPSVPTRYESAKANAEAAMSAFIVAALLNGSPRGGWPRARWIEIARFDLHQAVDRLADLLALMEPEQTGEEPFYAPTYGQLLDESGWRL